MTPACDKAVGKAWSNQGNGAEGGNANSCPFQMLNNPLPKRCNGCTGAFILLAGNIVIFGMLSRIHTANLHAHDDSFMTKRLIFSVAERPSGSLRRDLLGSG